MNEQCKPKDISMGKLTTCFYLKFLVLQVVSIITVTIIPIIPFASLEFTSFIVPPEIIFLNKPKGVNTGGSFGFLITMSCPSLACLCQVMMKIKLLCPPAIVLDSWISKCVSYLSLFHVVKFIMQSNFSI